MKEIRVEPHNHDSTQSKLDDFLLAQVRESFGRVVYSHKVHEKQADRYFCYHRWLQVALIMLTAISSGTFITAISDVINNSTFTSLTTSSVALITTWISLGAKTFNFSEEANSHRAVASELWNIRESYISLIADLMLDNPHDTNMQDRRDELQKEAYYIYSNAPRTQGYAFKQAQKGLKKNEEMTFTTDEIDKFLPEALRLSNRTK